MDFPRAAPPRGIRAGKDSRSGAVIRRRHHGSGERGCVLRTGREAPEAAFAALPVHPAGLYNRRGDCYGICSGASQHLHRRGARGSVVPQGARGDTVRRSWARLSGVSAEGLPPIPVTITAEGTIALQAHP